MKIVLQKNLAEENWDDEIEELFLEKGIIDEDKMVFEGHTISAVPFCSQEEKIEWANENAIILKDEKYFYIAIKDQEDYMVERKEIRKHKYLDEVDEDANDDLEEKMRESVRDKIIDIVDEDLDKIEEIRRLNSEIFDSPVHYQNTVSSATDYRMAVLDELEDDFWNCPELLEGNNSLELLEGEITHLEEEFDSRMDSPDCRLTDVELDLCCEAYSALIDNKLERVIDILSTYSDNGVVKKYEEGKQVLEIDEFKFSDWLKNAWLHQHDGWNRDLWWDSEDLEFWSTTETKSTSFVNGNSVVLICHVSGDNNADYNSICDFCSSHDENYEHCCDAWEGYHESFPEDDFEDMQFDCMGNVGWTDNIKEEIEERLKNDFYIEWV